MAKYTQDKPNSGEGNPTVSIGKVVIPRGQCGNCGNGDHRVGLSCPICGGEVSDGTMVRRVTLPMDEYKAMKAI